MNENTIYHIGLSNTQNAKYAILTGDPGRTDAIAAKMKNPIKLADNREYRTWSCELNDERVFVTSTGIGGPSAAIAVEELFMAGVRTFIRVGTCGGMQLKVNAGDLIIATGAVRAEGASKEYVSIEYPAVADLEVTMALKDSAKESNNSYHCGIIQSKDSFYGQHNPDRMPLADKLKSSWDMWIKAGCLASEMECASIFIVSSVLGARAGAVLHTVWNQERKKAGLNDEQRLNVDSAIDVSIRALGVLISNDKNN